jgi:aminotransferase
MRKLGERRVPMHASIGRARKEGVVSSPSRTPHAAHVAQHPSPLRARLASRISTPDESYRIQMYEIAATRDDIVAMGPGDPDLPTPPHIVEAAKQALDAGATHYTPPPGDIRLRRAIARMLAETRGIDYDPDSEVIVTLGAEEGIYMALLALLDPGDEVLVPDHRFTTYDWAIELSGGRLVAYPTLVDGAFQLSAAEIARRLTPRSKILVVVSPDNPTGGVATGEEISALARLAIERDLLVVSDEIYSKFVFDDRQHHSILSIPGLRERTLLIDGFSKCYAMTGWRVGFLCGPSDFMRAIVEVKHTLSICTPAISQAAALAAVEGPQDCIAAMRHIYDNRRHALMAALADMGLSFVYPAGAFYVYVDVSSTGMPSPAFCLRLLEETGIMISPGTIFGSPDGERYVRMSLLVPDERMAEALERMEAAIKRYKAGATA